jgi:hypothetical protein
MASIMFSLALSGCTALSYGTYSGVEDSNQIVLQKASHYWAGVNPPDILEFDDFQLTIRPYNWRISVNIWGPFLPLFPLPGGPNDSEAYSDIHQHDWFLVTLFFDSKGEDLSFDPSRVLLRTSKDEELTPVGFWGITPDYNGCLGYETTKLKRSPDKLVAALKPIALTAKSCFTLLYQTKPPSPDSTFVLDITGLHKGSQAISIKPLKFVKHSGWDYSYASIQ